MRNAEYESICRIIKEASESNQLVVFIGAGMSNNFGFPTWQELTGEMYGALTGKEPAKNKYFSSDELLRIPQALRDKDKPVYQGVLKKHFGAQRVKDSENAMLDEIMKLKPKHIITTNFDTLIERYLQDKEDALYRSHSAKEGYAKLVRHQIPYHYARVVKDGDMVSANANHLLLKIHGDVQNMDFLVLCEDDYLAYSDSHILMENFIKSLLINHTFLFIGYGVGDSNLKLIMKWVDNVVSRQKGSAAQRKKHILLYPDKKSMDSLQKAYFEKKQIQVLEFGKLPFSCRREEITEFTDIRGKNLLRILRAIGKADKAEAIDKELLAETLTYFSQRKYIHVWEVEAVLKGTGFEIQKEDTRLVLWKDTRGSSFMEQVIRSAKKGEKEVLSAEAGDFLSRLGVNEYRYMWKEETFPIFSGHSRYSVLEKACLTSDYTGLYQYVKRNKDFSFAERACWAMYTDNGAEAKKWLEKQWDSREKMGLYEHLRFAYNLQQDFELEEKYDVRFPELWENIPDAEKEKFALIKEYMTECMELYHAFGRISDKVKLECSMEYSDTSFSRDPEEFARCRTALLDFIMVFILNGWYIAGLWPTGVSYGGLSNLMYAYSDTILFLASPECRRKPKWFRLCSRDIFILINMIDRRELKKLLEKHKITCIHTHVDGEDSIGDILRENCINLLIFNKKRISKENTDGHLSQRRIESCMALMERLEWKKEDLETVIAGIFSYLIMVMPLDRKTRIWFADMDVFYPFLRAQSEKECKDMISLQAGNLLTKMLHIFLKEDHENQYSKFLEDNVEWYRDTRMAAQLIDKENNRVSKKLTGECWDCYKKWYGSSASWLMADIYPFAEDKVKKEISELACQKIRGMETGLLRCYMENDILSYTDEIKEVLLDKCQRFSKLNERQRGKSGNNQSPLPHILRLWQKGKIPEIEMFRDYKESDPWFSFVCFPEEFDYGEFDVRRWCTWLGEERYRGEAFEKNKRVLQKKFLEAMEDGAGEDVRRIYYKYLE